MSAKGNVVGGGMVLPSGRLNPVIADKGDPGKPGAASTTPGPNGWSPVFAGEADGTRTLMRVIDWTGGQGTKPDAGMYIGTSGYVTTKAAAFNFNIQKRVRAYSQTTGAGGVAVIDYSAMGFTVSPQVLPLSATGTVVTAPTRATVYDVTTTTAKVRVEAMTAVTSLWNALLGATANVLVIEA